jgi:methylated-DNA-[protein]-cysteine S-methyltransferase
VSDVEKVLERGPQAPAGEAARLARAVAERAAADGEAFAYASVESPFGPLLAARGPQGLVRLAFPEEEVDGVLGDLCSRVTPRLVEAPGALDPVRRELEEYFAGRRQDFETPIDWRLVAPFGRRVLAAAVAIPYGSTLTYTEVAALAGSPRGSRAAGNALGANPIPIVVPCHRVLRRGGALGGYAGGLERKRYLLDLETV